MAQILILDDEGDLTELYRMALEAAGHRVLGIYDNPLKVLSGFARELRPDVIILDERLNGLSGIAYLSQLREAFPRSKVLFASADPDAVELSVLRRADAAKKKPFPLGDLVKAIDKLARCEAGPKECEDPA